MLKNLLVASAAVAALVAFSAPGFAQTDTISITGTVAAKCSVQNATGTISLTDLDSNADGTYAGETVPDFNLGAIWCNGSHNTIAITAKPITTPHTITDTPFTNRIDYTLAPGTGSSLGAIQPMTTVGADAAVGAQSSEPNIPAFDTGASHSTFSMKTVSTGSNKLLAGDYTGEIDIVVTPGL